MSYSGLKTAAVNQLDQFWDRRHAKTKENIAAAFQKAAIDILVGRTLLGGADTGLPRSWPAAGWRPTATCGRRLRSSRAWR